MVCDTCIITDLFCRLKEQQDLSISEEDIDKCSHNVEGEMFSFFGDTGHRYKNKYRSLMFNLKDPRNKASMAQFRPTVKCCADSWGRPWFGGLDSGVSGVWCNS